MIWCLAAIASEIVVSSTVQDAIDQAKPGDVVVVPEGRWPGPVHIDRPITLTSRGGTVVGETGSTVIVDAPGAVVEGLTIRGSGEDLRGPDSCIYVEPSATGAVISGNRLEGCLFGIWVHQVTAARVLNNHVVGLREVRAPSKGNGIHLFDSTELEVRGNRVEGARDGIYVSATHRSVIADNVVSDQRYGIHYMYSYDNEVRGNTANNNSGGIALMQSRNLVVTDNVCNDNERQGIMFRDLTDSVVRGNVVGGNGEGMFFFSSVRNEVSNNTIAGNQIGARVWAGTVDNDVRDNRFVNNRVQVFYVASADQEWGANYWSDYLGWDQDGDGHGDRIYRSEAFTSQLLHRYPQATLLLSSPTLELLAHLQGRVAALRVPSVVDRAPLISASQEP